MTRSAIRSRSARRRRSTSSSPWPAITNSASTPASTTLPRGVQEGREARGRDQRAGRADHRDPPAVARPARAEARLGGLDPRVHDGDPVGRDAELRPSGRRPARGWSRPGRGTTAGSAGAGRRRGRTRRSSGRRGSASARRSPGRRRPAATGGRGEVGPVQPLAEPEAADRQREPPAPAQPGALDDPVVGRRLARRGDAEDLGGDPLPLQAVEERAGSTSPRRGRRAGRPAAGSIGRVGHRSSSGRETVRRGLGRGVRDRVGVRRPAGYHDRRGRPGTADDPASRRRAREVAEARPASGVGIGPARRLYSGRPSDPRRGRSGRSAFRRTSHEFTRRRPRRPPPAADELMALLNRLLDNVGSVVLGKPEVIKLAVVALLAEGHVLIEDVPGRRQDPARPGPGREHRLLVPPAPVHARPAPLGHPRLERLQRGQRASSSSSRGRSSPT